MVEVKRRTVRLGLYRNVLSFHCWQLSSFCFRNPVTKLHVTESIRSNLHATTKVANITRYDWVRWRGLLLPRDSMLELLRLKYRLKLNLTYLNSHFFFCPKIK